MVHLRNNHSRSVRIALSGRQVMMGKWKLKSPLQ